MSLNDNRYQNAREAERQLGALNIYLRHSLFGRKKKKADRTSFCPKAFASRSSSEMWRAAHQEEERKNKSQSIYISDRIDGNTAAAAAKKKKLPLMHLKNVGGRRTNSSGGNQTQSFHSCKKKKQPHKLCDGKNTVEPFKNLRRNMRARRFH